MRLNDEGITAIANAIKDQWGYLKVDGTDSAVLTLVSSVVTDNYITLVFELGVLELNGETVNSSALTKTALATVLESGERFTDIDKDDLTRYRFTYTISLIR
jgi:hypothetical protein